MKRSMFAAMALIGLPAYSQQLSQAQPIVQYAVLVMIVLLLVLIIVDLFRRAQKPEDSSQYRLLNTQHQDALKEVNQLQGRASQLETDKTRIQMQLEIKSNELAEGAKRIASFEAYQAQSKKDADKNIQDLENARKALEDERKRVQDAERQALEEAEATRTRIWSLHEESARTQMREICQKADIGLPTFDNANLPDGFDPKLKPDFMIRLMGQYVIFDPKSSPSQNLQLYIKSQVQATAKKIRGSDSYNDIYKSVFFVVPDIGLKELREIWFVEQGISFAVIPIQAFEPIVRTLKRLEDYDLADKYDPQERENIVNVLATYDQHIRQQNAINILSTIRGIKVMSDKDTMPADVVRAVETRRTKLRLEQMSPSSLKKLMDNPESQAKELLGLIAPKKPAVETKDVVDVEPLF